MRSLLLIWGLASFAQAVVAATDPFTSQQWGLHNTGKAQRIELDHITAYEVPARSGEDVNLPAPLKAKKVLVAVLDTGIDHDHPDLKGAIHRNESECKALEKFLACVKARSRPECEKIWMDPKNPEVDQDHNGYPMDCSGWSILGGTNAAGLMGRPDFGDDQGHGTHVAGIIGAMSGNGVGVRGVSENVEILPVQVLGNQPTEPLKPLSVEEKGVPPSRGPSADPLDPKEAGKSGVTHNLADLVARGVTYAIRSGAQVINFSMGWPQNSDSEYLRQVIREAQKRGIIIVAAAGNDSTRALLRPCAYPGVICVAAHGPDGSLSHFSNYGTGVEIAAPGTNILSTYPQEIRPVRFRSTNGYEFLNGTSQASPFVAGAVAEMLARGIPASEIPARLILGSRHLQAKLPLLEGSPEDMRQDRKPEDPSVEKKWILGGELDLGRALTAKPEALILPVSKEKSVLQWNVKDRELVFQFEFTNQWQAIDMSAVQVASSTRRTSDKEIRPRVTETKWLDPVGSWTPGQSRTLQITAVIEDDAPERTQIPSEIDFNVQVTTPTHVQKLVLETEVIVPVGLEHMAANWFKIPLAGLPQARSSLIPIDENLDGQKQTDYLAVGGDGKTNTYLLMKYDRSSRSYVGRGTLKVAVADGDKTREQFLARLDLDGDGHSGYVLGLFTDLSEDQKPSTAQIYFLNDQFVQKGSLMLDGKTAATPTRLYWHQIQGKKRPAWVGSGHATETKASLIDDWENPDGAEKSEIRFYYTDLSGHLKSVQKYQDYQIIDILEPSLDQVKAGRVPVLLAKNRGTELKPSYIYDFAAAEVFEGQVTRFQRLDFSQEKSPYRNLLDTKVDKVLSLDLESSSDLTHGTFWFGEGADHSQRVSLLLKDQGHFQMLDATLPALRGTVDSSLWVRAVFSGQHETGAFVFTNSEIQYHDLVTHEAVARSFERYTFYSDLLFSNLHFPTVVKDEKTRALRPALFTTESSGFSRGVRIKIPLRDSSGHLLEITTPARLRLESQAGCRPLETPVQLDEGSTALDYFCGSSILRVPLEF